ncbi:SsrA-binding protein SmpB [Hellea sp.]|jgi:SsrA-binding protein|nr:SsrA-binding protein SmpB [Hellea sp.]MBT3593919.1 SsrA-binding protein SmpB [Hellea sp.]MBT5836131.1 SsrA-binding protein SmpB [Hellea sp.]MBT7398717.1 SsrA-binding protein SmpB [Hellea sp.]MDA9048029.1 SsrA-binding protein SmpB [Hellea sp.]MDB4844536.1 SsrA-binding protein SmpB [Hellea sp.]
MPSEIKKLIAENRRARFDYLIEEVVEAGIILVGTEVKSLREGQANIAESYAAIENQELFLINATIPIYAPASQFNHLPTRPRKLLIKQNEINKLWSLTQRKGKTLIPLKIYFDVNGRVKVQIGTATGKDNKDKRESVKKRDWQRDKSRLMRDRG